MDFFGLWRGWSLVRSFHSLLVFGVGCALLVCACVASSWAMLLELPIKP